jgi:phosphohistidine phosphatase
MNLFILRHGIAVAQGEPGVPKDLSDADRSLTAAGRKKLARSTRAMRAMGLRFDVVLSSPLVRTMQTAEVVIKKMAPRRNLVVTANLAPGASKRDLIHELNRFAPRATNVLLVGHEPDLSELIGLLCAGDTAASIELKKGGLAKLESPKLRHGRCATLNWLLTPKQMRLMR